MRPTSRHRRTDRACRSCGRGLLVALALLACSLPALAAEVTEVRVGKHPEFTRVVFQLDAPAGYRLERDGTRLTVTLDAGASARSIPFRTRGISKVEVDAGRGTSVARISLREPGIRVKEMILANPPRIVLDVMRENTMPVAKKPAPKPAPEPVVAKTPEPAPEPEVAKPPAPKPAPAPVVAKKPAPKPVAKKPAPVVAKKPAPEPAPEPVVEKPPAPAPKPVVAKTPAPEVAKPAKPAAKPAVEEPSEAPVADATPEAAPDAEPLEVADAEPTAPSPVAPKPVAPKPVQPKKAAPKPVAPKTAKAPAPAPSSEGGWWSNPLVLAAGAGVLLCLVGFFLMRRRRPLPNDLDVMAIADESSTGDDDSATAHDTLLGSAPSFGGDSEMPGAASAESGSGTLDGLFDDEPATDSRTTEPAAMPEPAAPVSEPASAGSEMDSLFETDVETVAVDPNEATTMGDPTMNQGMSDLPADPDRMDSPPPAPVAAAPAGADSDVLRVVHELERRMAQLEGKLEEANEARERLERQVAAQSEELRVQRAAIARTQRALRTMSRGDEDKATEPALRDSDTQAKTRVSVE